MGIRSRSRKISSVSYMGEDNMIVRVYYTPMRMRWAVWEEIHFGEREVYICVLDYQSELALFGQYFCQFIVSCITMSCHGERNLLLKI